MNGGETAGRCRNCGGAAPVAATGRPRLYCSQACRQAAYRGRRAAGGKQAAADAAQARELARTLAAAARDLARAVADPAAGDAIARQAATQATAALAALTRLGGLPTCDETPVPVTEPGSAIAGSGRGAGQEHPGTAAAAARCRAAGRRWARSADRATWVAEASGLLLAVTRATDGTWHPAVHGNGTEVSGPPVRTRTAAQRWAERQLHAGSDETASGRDETRV